MMCRLLLLVICPTAAVQLPTLADFKTGYSRLTREHYLACAFGQAGVLASCADTATQLMESGTVSVAHVAAMAAVASTMSGVANAIWLRQLESAFPGTAGREVAAKTLIHAIIIASIINSAYLVGVPFLTTLFTDGHLVSAPPEWCAHVPPAFEHLGPFQSCHPSSTFLLDGWTIDEFITLTKLEVAMFIPYNTLAFKLVPPQVRPLTHAMISATFNVAVSAVTLGYFDTWCARAAAHVLG